MTYARGEGLSVEQRATQEAERTSGDVPADLLVRAETAIAAALAQLRATPESVLPDRRAVGRAGHPSTVLGLLFHSGEHTTRHVGQLITTLKVVRGMRLAP